MFHHQQLFRLRVHHVTIVFKIMFEMACQSANDYD